MSGYSACDTLPRTYLWAIYIYTCFRKLITKENVTSCPWKKMEWTKLVVIGATLKAPSVVCFHCQPECFTFFIALVFPFFFVCPRDKNLKDSRISPHSDISFSFFNRCLLLMCTFSPVIFQIPRGSSLVWTQNSVYLVIFFLTCFQNLFNKPRASVQKYNTRCRAVFPFIHKQTEK